MSGTRSGRRSAGRADTRDSYCLGCGARRTIGAPNSRGYWAQRLRLTPEQVDDLLVAAQEYAELCEESNIVETAVEFVDWMSIDALKRAA